MRLCTVERPFISSTQYWKRVRNDEWGKIFSTRICNVVDLFAAEARYHSKFVMKYYSPSCGNTWSSQKFRGNKSCFYLGVSRISNVEWLTYRWRECFSVTPTGHWHEEFSLATIEETCHESNLTGVRQPCLGSTLSRRLQQRPGQKHLIPCCCLT